MLKVVKVIVMKRQNKIVIANGLTVLAAFATLLCLFAVDGISLQTVIAVAAAYSFAHITVCLFKVENILRRQHAAAIRRRRQSNTRNTFAVVRNAKQQAA